MTEIKKLVIKGGIQNQTKNDQTKNLDNYNLEDHLLQIKSELLEEIDKKINKALDKNKKR